MQFIQYYVIIDMIVMHKLHVRLMNSQCLLDVFPLHVCPNVSARLVWGHLVRSSR